MAVQFDFIWGFSNVQSCNKISLYEINSGKLLRSQKVGDIWLPAVACLRRKVASKLFYLEKFLFSQFFKNKYLNSLWIGNYLNSLWIGNYSQMYIAPCMRICPIHVYRKCKNKLLILLALQIIIIIDLVLYSQNKK